MIEQAAAAISAHAKWAAAGFPTRSAEEIARVYAICVACDEFRAAPRPLCSVCGCLLRDAGVVANKIALATEACPLGKWQ